MFSVKTHPDLKELLQFALLSDGEDRRQVLNDLRDYDQPKYADSLVVFDTKELTQIIEDTLGRIGERTVQQLDEATESDLVSLLSFFLGSFPLLIHANEALFAAFIGRIDSLLHHTASESTQTQCFILLRSHIRMVLDLNVELGVKLSRLQLVARLFNVGVMPNSIAYIEKLRSHLSLIEATAQLLRSPAESSESLVSEPTRLECFVLLIDPICKLLAAVFMREPAELRDVNVSDGVQVAKCCLQRAHAALQDLQQSDIAATSLLKTPGKSPTNSLVFCVANQERIVVTHRLFSLMERLVVDAKGENEYWRFFRSRMLYLTTCALWPFALVTVTSANDQRFRRSLSSSALLAFRAFIGLFEHSFVVLRARAATCFKSSFNGSDLTYATHVRTVQSVLRTIDLAMRHALVESDDSVQLTNTLLCTLSIESLFAKLNVDSCLNQTNPTVQIDDQNVCQPKESDVKPGGTKSSLFRRVDLGQPRIKATERFLNEIVASVLLRFCIFNSPNDVVYRPQAICEFFTLLTIVVRRAALSGVLEPCSLNERVPLTNVLRFCEQSFPLVRTRIVDYQNELVSMTPSTDYADRLPTYSAAFVNLWNSFATFLAATLSRPTEKSVDDVSVNTVNDSFRLNFGLTSCPTATLHHTSTLLEQVLDAGLELGRVVLEHEPMGVKRAPLFNQFIDTFETAFDRLCAIYERLFEDRSPCCARDEIDSTAMENPDPGPTPTPPGDRPACYRLRLQFDLLRADFSKCKAIVAKQASCRQTLPPGGNCSAKSRRPRRRDSWSNGNPKRNRSSGGKCSRNSSGKPIESFGQFAHVKVAGEVGLGRFSKPHFAGKVPTAAAAGGDAEAIAEDGEFQVDRDLVGLEVDFNEIEATELLEDFVQSFETSELMSDQHAADRLDPMDDQLLSIEVLQPTITASATHSTTSTMLADSGTHSETELGNATKAVFGNDLFLLTPVDLSLANDSDFADGLLADDEYDVLAD